MGLQHDQEILFNIRHRLLFEKDYKLNILRNTASVRNISIWWVYNMR